MLGELPEAIDCLERAFTLSEGSPNAHSNLGIVYSQVGRFDDALAHFRTAIQMEPDGRLLHSNAAYGLLIAGEIVEGWREWEWGALYAGPRGEERRLDVPRWTPDTAPGASAATASRASATSCCSPPVTPISSTQPTTS